MPKGVHKDEETLGTPNTENISFRVPVEMKSDIKVVLDYLKFNSFGEFFRTLYREKKEDVWNSPGFKLWLNLRKEDKEFQLEQLRTKARQMGYELQKVDQRVLA